MLGHHRPLEYRRVPRLRPPFAWILAARASKWTWRAFPLQMGIQPKKGRKEQHGEAQQLVQDSKNYFSKSAYIPQVVHKEIMEYAELCRGSSPEPH